MLAPGIARTPLIRRAVFQRSDFDPTVGRDQRPPRPKPLSHLTLRPGAAAAVVAFRFDLSTDHPQETRNNDGSIRQQRLNHGPGNVPVRRRFETLDRPATRRWAGGPLSAPPAISQTRSPPEDDQGEGTCSRIRW